MHTYDNRHPEPDKGEARSFQERLDSGSTRGIPKLVRNDNGGFGFTLIELLVTISIISILTIIGMVSYQVVLKNGRDAKRQADFKIIQSSLEQYHSDQFFYPSGILTWGSSLTSSTGNPSPPSPVKTYLNTIPTDPIANPQYNYVASPSGCNNSALNRCVSYCLYARVENFTPTDTLCVNDSTRTLEITPP